MQWLLHLPPLNQRRRQYMDGVEVDCDLVLSDGEVAFGSVTDNWPTWGARDRRCVLCQQPPCRSCQPQAHKAESLPCCDRTWAPALPANSEPALECTGSCAFLTSHAHPTPSLRNPLLPHHLIARATTCRALVPRGAGQPPSLGGGAHGCGHPHVAPLKGNVQAAT